MEALKGGDPAAGDFARHRSRLLLVVSAGYGSMLAFRPTVMMSLPWVLADLKLTQEDGGILISTCQVANMISKPLAQVTSDGLDARLLLLCSLLSTAFFCCLLPLSACRWDLQLLLFWVMACQAPYGPASAKVLTNWYPVQERGSAFSFMNASANLTSCAVPYVVNAVLFWGSWRNLYTGIAVAIAALALLHWPILVERPSGAHRAFQDATPAAGARGEGPGMAAVVRKASVWAAGAIFAALYVIRFGLEGWVGTFLRKSSSPTKREAAAGSAAAFLFWWQAGGFVGASLVGPASDLLGGRMLPLAAACAGLLSGAMGLLHAAEHAELPATWFLLFVAALSGACVYGLRLLLTLFTRAQVPTSVAGRADAVVSSLAELGGAMAGLPLIRLVAAAGSWRAYTAALTATALSLGLGTAALWLSHTGAPGARAAAAAEADSPAKKGQ